MVDIFQKYKEIDLEILESIQYDRENIALLESREAIINEILLSNMDKKQFKMKYEQYGLSQLDNKIGQKIKEKLDLVKAQIEKTKIAKEANKGYASSQRLTNVFSEKV